MNEADQKQIDILCMPELYLNGNPESKEEAIESSIDLNSPVFKKLCQQLHAFKYTTLLLGLNEYEQGEVFNTVVVIEQGQYIGKYRKAYFDNDHFSLGHTFPVFNKRGIQYGIVICLDSWYYEPAKIMALTGATWVA